jgi:periplasmic divalent cation tolerance protein
MSADPVVVLVTGPAGDEMRTLAEQVVSARLAACVNLVDGVVSVYRWEGAVQTDREVLAVMKTTRDRLPALRNRVVALHPYDVPEFVAVPIVDGSKEYLDWMCRAVEDERTE